MRRLAAYAGSHALDLSGRRALHSAAPEARAFILAPALAARSTKSLIVTANYERALSWQARLSVCGFPDKLVRQLPSGLSALFEDSSPELNAISDRIGALRFLIEPGPGVVLATPQSALERTLPRDVLQSAFLEVLPGSELSIEELLAKLQMLGYEYAEPVRLPGQFSRRGGILDVFSMGKTLPVRIEFFGDEVESIRAFDPNSQRSIGSEDSLMLSPSRETLFLPGAESFKSLLEHALQVETAALGADAAERLHQSISADIEGLEAGAYFDRIDLYRPLLHPDSDCALDLMAEQGWLILDEPHELEAICERAQEELAESLEARAARGEILHSHARDFMLPTDHLSGGASTIALDSMGGLPTWLSDLEPQDIDSHSLEPYRGRPESLASTVRTWLEGGMRIILGTDQPTRAHSVLAGVQLFPSEDLGERLDGLAPGLYIASGNLAGGFIMPPLKLAVLTDMELFGVSRLRLPQRRFNEGTPVATVLDLKPGDYVVHIAYGIGIFQGLTKRVVDGVEKEYLFIQYQAPDKLFVPADQLDRIQKYLNPGDEHPKLNRLTGGEWQRTVGKAREEAREFAHGLIKLYAARKKVHRPSFGPDSPWQAEMEATFPWVETASQMEAIRETKNDLLQPYPMDRLVCGDVGFGKTEVAIRAAFKVAQSGRQVAVLCPTTILSEQHYRNFSERLAPFPTRVALLNRFCPPAERRQTLEGLAEGRIDIVIGTHALLAKQLDFKDLGLVVIDEEQKFGVKQKEALKELRVSVDVLTLSATPIPRTLSMALMDIRQMSLINDPPPGRLPIRTVVRPFSTEVVREAVLREMARGGQVYYVYNRVESIYHVAERLRKLLPTARLGVGHGQMKEAELEPIMLGFIKGEIDVLLSTTIIENGLDIPNANTLIVENADRLGLAQLYQLRGRVGRSDRQAYAYLLYQANRELQENAVARLQSLQEFSALGSGYSLAFRDLQIRGAGELLGAKQSGSMAAVGYELYSQLINEEIELLKAYADGSEPPREARDEMPRGLAPLPMIDLPVVALLPEWYIEDHSQRLYYYKELMSSRQLDRLEEVRSEISDRYGRAPEEVLRAFAIMRLRLLAKDLSIEKVEGSGGRLLVSFAETAGHSSRVFSMLARKNREAYLTRGQLIWPYQGDPIGACESMMEALQASVREVEEQRAALEV